MLGLGREAEREVRKGRKPAPVVSIFPILQRGDAYNVGGALDVWNLADFSPQAAHA